MFYQVWKIDLLIFVFLRGDKSGQLWNDRNEIMMTVAVLLFRIVFLTQVVHYDDRLNRSVCLLKKKKGSSLPRLFWMLRLQWITICVPLSHLHNKFKTSQTYTKKADWMCIASRFPRQTVNQRCGAVRCNLTQTSNTHTHSNAHKNHRTFWARVVLRMTSQITIVPQLPPPSARSFNTHRMHARQKTKKHIHTNRNNTWWDKIHISNDPYTPVVPAEQVALALVLENIRHTQWHTHTSLVRTHCPTQNTQTRTHAQTSSEIII